MNEKLTEYSQRHKEWRDISTTQLSAANNILITISSGYLILIFEKARLSKLHFDISSNIDWSIFIYFVSILLTLFAIFLGVLVMINRLYDFRISRHLALTRKRIYKKYSEKLPESSLGAISKWNIVIEQLNIIFKKIDFISLDEIESFKENKVAFESKFNRLRRQSKVIGSIPHKWTKFQILLLLFSLTLYLISVVW